MTQDISPGDFDIVAKHGDTPKKEIMDQRRNRSEGLTPVPAVRSADAQLRTMIRIKFIQIPESR